MKVLKNRHYYLSVALFIIAGLLLHLPRLDAASPDTNLIHDVKKSSTDINISIDWNQVIRKIPPYAYGVNSPANFIPEFSNDRIFMNTLSLITQKKGFIRLHGWGMLADGPESWQQNGVWDASKIGQALQPLVDEGYTVMINIPSGSLGENDFQDPARFAKFCADLVKIVNVDLKLGVKYWEIPNEREAGFIDAGLSVSDMATLIQTASQAMKVVDPNIKVGGPATAWVNINYITDIVRQSYPNIDFVSVHSYSGDGSNNVKDAYNIAQFATADLAKIRENINLITGDNYLPLFLTEYNIAYQNSPRMLTNIGAVYDAIILTESIKAGADASMFWNMAPYSDMSLIDGDNNNANIHLFKIFNQSFHGNLIASLSNKPNQIVSYAVSNNDNQTKEVAHAFALINRTATPQSIILDLKQWLPTDLVWHLWDADNEFTTTDINWSEYNKGSITLSAYSVNLYIEKSEETSPTTPSNNEAGGSFFADLLVLFIAVLYIRRKTQLAVLP